MDQVPSDWLIKYQLVQMNVFSAFLAVEGNNRNS
jgi:hypothetical protein